MTDGFKPLKKFIFCFVALSMITVSSFCSASALPKGRLIGIEPIDALLMEDHSDAFIAWRHAQIQRRTVVHIDSHIDIEWIPDPALKRILNAKKEGEIRRLLLDPLHPEKISLKPLSIMNFLYPAIMEGMIKELYWVHPNLFMGGESDLKKFKSHLIETLGKISIEDLNSFQLQKGVIKGKLYGISLIVCNLTDLPRFERAVILDIDVDYFDPPTIEKRIDLPFLWPEEFIGILKHRGIRSDLVTICYSVRGGYLPLEYRFLGESLMDILKDPEGHHPILPKIRQHRKSGYIYRSRKMYHEAIGEFQKALKLNPMDASLQYGLALLYDHIGKSNEAAMAFARAAKIDPMYGNSLLYDADYYFNKKRYEKALSLYEELLKKNPHYLKGILEAGVSASRLGQLEEAATYYRKLIELYPNFYLAHFNLGVIYSKQKRWEKEEEAYIHALELNPYFGKAYQNLGLLHATRGEIDKAMRAFERAVELNPCFKEVHNNLGILYARSGKFSEAIREFRKAVRIDPNYAVGYSNLGKMFLMEGRVRDASEALDHAVSIDPKNIWARYYLGQSYATEKRYKEAVSAYEGAIRTDPDFYPAYIDLARILGEYGSDMNRAIELARRAVELKPTALTLDLLAGLCLKRGFYEEANRAVEKALALDPGNEQILQRREQIRKKMRK